MKYHQFLFIKSSTYKANAQYAVDCTQKSDFLV